MDQDLIKLLENAGFTEKEAQVYLALLELGQGNVTQIAKMTDLKRSIIYVILEGLIKRGYASEIPNKKINTYQAADPTVILRELKVATQNFSEMIPIFQTLGNKNNSRPKITYHENKEGIWKVWEEMSSAEESFFISSYEKINEKFPKALDSWIADYKKRPKKHIYKHLIPDNPNEIELIGEFLEVNQDIRALKELNGMKMDFTIYNNKLAITSLEESPFVVVIESDELVNSMRPILEIAWEKGRKLKKNSCED